MTSWSRENWSHGKLIPWELILWQLLLWELILWKEKGSCPQAVRTCVIRNLSLSTKRRGGLYAGCDNFSCDYALPSGHEVIVSGGWGLSVGPRWARGGEMLTTLAVGWRALALSLGWGARKQGASAKYVPGVSNHWCGRSVFAVHFNGRQPSGFK